MIDAELWKWSGKSTDMLDIASKDFLIDMMEGITQASALTIANP